MKAAIGTALTVALVVATYEIVQNKIAKQQDWAMAVKGGFMNPIVYGVAAAGAVAGYLSSRR